LQPFTVRDLNRATLARQLLLERVPLSVPRAVERLCAMQAQAPNAPYVGLWSRLAGFRHEQLTRAYERRKVVRATLFRVTIQLVSARDHASYAAMMHARWRDEFVNWNLPAVEWAKRIHALAGDEPFTYADANRAVPELPERYRWRVRCLTPLVHVPPAGTWGATRVQVTTAERWLGRISVEPADAAALVLRRYLAAFGPASKADLLRFTGLRAKDVQAGFARLQPQLVTLQADDGRALVDLRRAPRPAADMPAPVRFLPEWDHLILGYDDRTRVLPPEYREAVIRNNGDVYRTFLVDGMVAGTWSHEDGKVKPRPLAPLPRTVRRDVEDEARRLQAFHAAARPTPRRTASEAASGGSSSTAS
jgi:Winged helix DNA-binding domain